MNELIDNIMESLEEDTTSANIAYLPSGFAVIKPVLNALARMKKDWNIDILENEDDYLINFENKCQISVKKAHLESFRRDTNIDIGQKIISLDQFLNEAEDEIESLLNMVNINLHELMVRQPINNVDNDLEHWSRLFKGNDISKEDDVALRIGNLEQNMKALNQEIRNKYSDDRGNLELLIDALKNKTPLNAFDVFKNYNYLFGGRMKTVYSGVSMYFEAMVDNSFNMTESILIESPELLDEIEDYKGVKVAKNIVFPNTTTGRFLSSFFGDLKKAIDLLM